jgi:tetratricopeptide (TPR) repeat protein
MTTSDDRSPHAASSIKIRLESTGEVAARVENSMQILERTDDAGEHARILIQISLDLRDGLRDPVQALDALIEAWRFDPTNPEILDHLEPLARAQNRWHEIFEVTRTRIAQEHYAERDVAYSEAMVRWLTREVPVRDHALQYLERIRALDSTHWMVHLFQAAKYEEHGDYKRELEELDRAVLSAKRPDDRARIHIMMAKRYGEERTKNAAAAKKHYWAAHRLEPQTMDPLRGLEAIYEKEGDRPALADVLEREIDAIDDQDERVAILLRLAEMYEKQFLKLDLAAEKLEQAFALDPNRMEALTALERCYTATRNWGELVRILEGAVVLVDDPQDRAERLIALAEIFESKIGDLPGAVSAYERLGRLIPDDETLVGELARLNEKMGDWQGAALHRSRLASLSTDPLTKARMHIMAAQLLLPHDPLAARTHFDNAVRYDPSNAGAWNALIEGTRATGDMARVAAQLEERAIRTEAPRAKAQVYVDLGAVRQSLGDEDGAIAAWEWAISADPNNEGAARALLDVYIAGGRWEEAAPLCDRVVYAAHRDNDTQLLFTARRHACTIAMQLGLPERALTMALDAFDLYPDDPDIKQTVVECSWTMRADPLVFHAIDALCFIAESADATGGIDLDTRTLLGEVLALVGERERAITIFEDVLQEVPDNQAALSGLAGLRAAGGESIAAWSLKRQLAETVADEEERFQMLLETAEGFATNAARPDLAAEVYESARAIRPTNRVLLHKLLTQYQTLENWPRVMNVLRSIADFDNDTKRKAKVVIAMAQISEEKLGERARAVVLFDEGLELDSTRLEAFESIVRIYTESRDWHDLERMYRRMIARAQTSGDTRLAHALFHQLGLIYRDRLNDRDGAITAFRAAVQLRPEVEQDQAILRELLAMTGQAGDAVSMTLSRVRAEPLDATPYPALYDLLVQMGELDHAWRIASVMAHLKIAHPPAAAFHRQYAPFPIEQIHGSLGEDGWRKLLHPDIDPTLTAIFETILPPVIQARIGRLGLRERLSYPGPALKQPDFILRDIEGAAHVLGLPKPRTFMAMTPPAIGVGATLPASLMVHPQSLPGFPRNLVAFWIGKRLLELTPPLLARGLFRSVSELKELVAAAVRLVREKRDKLSKSDEQLRAQLRKDQFEELTEAVERALRESSSLDVKRWSQLVDVSSSRAGLILAGDLENARLALMREAQSPGDLGPREQMLELLNFYLSDAYAELRAQLRVKLA